MDMMIFRKSEIAGQPLVYTRASQCWLMDMTGILRVKRSRFPPSEVQFALGLTWSHSTYALALGMNAPKKVSLLKHQPEAKVTVRVTAPSTYRAQYLPHGKWDSAVSVLTELAQWKLGD
jgi:hypothetical protein